jgi:N4-(beta-N-acetylglucosaminyl)-L-asparaginase
MILPISRRRFFGNSFGLTTGAMLARSLGLKPGSLPARKAGRAGATPMIATSHTNETGQAALDEAWAILLDGGSALDAVETATNVVEIDPEDTSVGYGGLPNEDGVVQLDASIMDGRTYNAGAVAGIENIKNPSSVARLVMERTDHVLLVGPAAKKFALSWGFPEENLLTEKARRAWLKWRETRSDTDDWGPPDHLKGLSAGQPGGDREAFLRGPIEHTHGTVNVLAVDARGDIAASGTPRSSAPGCTWTTRWAPPEPPAAAKTSSRLARHSTSCRACGRVDHPRKRARTLSTLSTPSTRRWESTTDRARSSWPSTGTATSAAPRTAISPSRPCP